MATRPKTPKPKGAAVPAGSLPEFYDWDLLVEESHVDRPPYKLRLRGEDGEFEYVTIPCPSGAAYINLSSAQSRVDVAGILINLTTSGENDEENSELFIRLMSMMSKADFPVVDKLATQVLAHYFNAPPKAEDGSEGGAGESVAS